MVRYSSLIPSLLISFQVKAPMVRKKIRKGSSSGSGMMSQTLITLPCGEKKVSFKFFYDVIVMNSIMAAMTVTIFNTTNLVEKTN
jgi:hypothetical protein